MISKRHRRRNRNHGLGVTDLISKGKNSVGLTLRGLHLVADVANDSGDGLCLEIGNEDGDLSDDPISEEKTTFMDKIKAEDEIQLTIRLKGEPDREIPLGILATVTVHRRLVALNRFAITGIGKGDGGADRGFLEEIEELEAFAGDGLELESSSGSHRRRRAKLEIVPLLIFMGLLKRKA